MIICNSSKDGEICLHQNSLFILMCLLSMNIKYNIDCNIVKVFAKSISKQVSYQLN